MPKREPAPGLVRFERSELKQPPVTLNPAQRAVCERTVIEACQHYRWNLKELHIRTEHLLVVLIADRTPEFVMNTIKVNATRNMRREGLLPQNVRPWSRHGSTRYLWTPEAAARACRYVRDGQGERLIEELDAERCEEKQHGRVP